MDIIKACAVGILFALIGCRSDNQQPPQLPITYKNITLTLAGDVIPKISDLDSDSEINLKADVQNTMLYAIQVHAKDNGQTYKPYCYGLFNNTDALNFKLPENYLFKFEASAVLNAENVIAVNTLNNQYLKPFSIFGSFNGEIPINSVIYSEDTFFNNLSKCEANLSQYEAKLFKQPNIDRYYGLLSDVNIDKQESIVLELKRVVFGLKFNITNFDNGIVTVKVKNAPEITLDPSFDKNQVHTFTMPHSLLGALEWTKDSYSTPINLIIEWKGDNQTINIYDNELTATRRGLFIINIDLTTTSEPSKNISITCEDSSWLQTTEIDT